MSKDKKKKKSGKEKKSEAAQLEGTNSQVATAPRRAAPKMKKKDFEKELEPLQVELVKLQEWVKANGAKICVIFEGRDTAGKGGVIRSITERVSPRVFRVDDLSSPTEREKSQMYIPAVYGTPACCRRSSPF